MPLPQATSKDRHSVQLQKHGQQQLQLPVSSGKPVLQVPRTEQMPFVGQPAAVLCLGALPSGPVLLLVAQGLVGHSDTMSTFVQYCFYC